MGGTYTKNAHARTNVTIMEVKMDWEELYKELAPYVSPNAKTVRMMLEENKNISENTLRVKLVKLVENHGWNKVHYRGRNWYWPPE